MRRRSRDKAYQQRQQAARTEGTLSVLDVARQVAEAGHAIHPLVRALCVEDVYLQVREGDRLGTSRLDDETYVHVYSSPTRAMAGLSIDDDQFDVRSVRLPQWLATLPSGTCVRLDPDTEVEVAFDPARTRLLLATAAGMVTPAALTPVLEEQLRHQAGPAETTDLDRAVRSAVSGRLRRCIVSLDGIGGRDWPVYLVEGDARTLLEVVDAVESAARRPVVVLADGQPTWLAALLEPAAAVAVEID